MQAPTKPPRAVTEEELVNILTDIAKCLETPKTLFELANLKVTADNCITCCHSVQNPLLEVAWRDMSASIDRSITSLTKVAN